MIQAEEVVLLPGGDHLGPIFHKKCHCVAPDIKRAPSSSRASPRGTTRGEIWPLTKLSTSCIQRFYCSTPVREDGFVWDSSSHDETYVGG